MVTRCTGVEVVGDITGATRTGSTGGATASSATRRNSNQVNWTAASGVVGTNGTNNGNIKIFYANK